MMLGNDIQHFLYAECRACGHQGQRISVFQLSLRYGRDYPIGQRSNTTSADTPEEKKRR